jgi:hypothetical protein
MPRKERDRMERMDELHRFLDQSNISARNMARLTALTSHADHQVAEHAALILEIARLLPGKRGRWPKLACRHPALFERAVRVFGLEFFEDLLAGYGDSESPLWEVLERYRIAPPWTTRSCDCGSGRAFRDCCLERENELRDQEVGDSHHPFLSF